MKQRMKIDGDLYDTIMGGAAVVAAHQTIDGWHVLVRSSRKQLLDGDARFLRFERKTEDEFRQMGGYNSSEPVVIRQFTEVYHRDLYKGYTGEELPDLSKKSFRKDVYDNLIRLGILPPPQDSRLHPNLKLKNG